jgi:hypothetical protein
VQQAFEKDTVPQNWKSLPSTSNASESIGADIKKSSASVSLMLSCTDCLVVIDGGKPVNMVDCLDLVWRYCDRICDDLELAQTGVILRHQRGSAKPGKAPRRPKSIKTVSKKRNRSSSRSSGRGSAKKHKKQVHFSNDGRKNDTSAELDGYTFKRASLCFDLNRVCF